MCVKNANLIGCVTGAEGKPAVKPLTSFGNGNSQKFQKPTAKVKPQMKCMASPSQELPPTILQRSNSRGSNASRMNDLDEISLTDPLPLARNANPVNQGNVFFIVCHSWISSVQLFTHFPFSPFNFASFLY